MSRRYCAVCGEQHRNKGEGLCDTHLARKREKEQAAHNERADMFESFMGLDEAERWERVFDALYDRGWRIWE